MGLAHSLIHVCLLRLLPGTVFSWKNGRPTNVNLADMTSDAPYSTVFNPSTTFTVGEVRVCCRCFLFFFFFPDAFSPGWC